MTVLILFMFLRAGIVHISYEERFAKYPGSEVRRDHTASIVSVGSGMDKHLFVNGIGITKLNPVTKVMAHLPLLYCSGKPESALVICFGMGTTYRSLLSWDIETTAVELVPSVKKAFPYYFDDAEEILQNPMGRIVIDDGRRFLKRTQEKYDVITIDPPPPVETAGSSFLYSEEFYDLVKLRLDEGGVLHQWFPAGELKILQAVTRSLTNSFPYVQVYQSFQGWGFHFIASVEPLPFPTAEELCSRMPISAQQDLMEWQTGTDVCGLLERILRNKIPLKAILAEDKTIVVTDDRPYNEYYILRRLRALMDKSFVKVM
jgi:spermidine synthase